MAALLLSGAKWENDAARYSALEENLISDRTLKNCTAGLNKTEGRQGNHSAIEDEYNRV